MTIQSELSLQGVEPFSLFKVNLEWVDFIWVDFIGDKYTPNLSYDVLYSKSKVKLLKNKVLNKRASF